MRTATAAAIVVMAAIVAACSTTSPQQQFVAECSSVGEAMTQVVAARRAGKIDTPTYNVIDDFYDDAVATCSSLPLNDTAAAVALDRVNAFLAAVGAATGTNYGTY